MDKPSSQCSLRRIRKHFARRTKMQTINLETKKKLIKKAQLRDVKQILLIDDEKNSILSAAIAREGYDVIQCDSVRKAWCLVYPHRPHLIILHLDSSKSTALADLQECLALAVCAPTIFASSDNEIATL